MGIVTDVILPLALAFIMFSLGLGLILACSWPGCSGRVCLKTWIHHKSRALGQENRVANADT